MRRAFIGLVLLIFINACREKLPDGVASPRVMTDLLFDLHLMDSKMSNWPVDSSQLFFEPAYGQIFKKYGLDSTSFRQTMQYYMTRPTQLLGFYREVQARLQKNIDNQMAKVQEDIRVKRYQDSLLVIRMRDSLFQVSLFIKQRDRIRHLFFLPESDSTIDQPVPYNFRNSARQLEEDLHIWRMHYLQVDSHDISREYDR